jgi:hypothetical protein
MARIKAGAGRDLHDVMEDRDDDQDSMEEEDGPDMSVTGFVGSAYRHAGGARRPTSNTAISHQ